MTGLEVLALSVGTAIGTTLGVRAWRSNPDCEPTCEPILVAPEGECPADQALRRQCDSIMIRYQRLADEGFVDRLSLDRANLLHDIATHAGCAAERAAARGELLAMVSANPLLNNADTPRAPQASAADGVPVRVATPDSSIDDRPSGS